MGIKSAPGVVGFLEMVGFKCLELQIFGGFESAAVKALSLKVRCLDQ